ncbi:SMI1/KNR4 family protein [Leifsonia sp. Leaf336]|uniref:SMI1/KNR4 family protein n=1 Tax=Leifsonia sp. Leaf336 TaxID=1736341 RepID=UPI000AE72B9D|nr:SMI1/KNR4 family protein [Leifsonia sp. Leaf336]
MNDLAETLPQIAASLQRLGRRTLLQSLKPGLERGEIVQQLSTAGFDSPIELHELYSWHDGTSTIDVALDDIHLFPGFYLLSLEDAIVNCLAFAADPRWGRGWLPVFANGGGDFYVIDLAPASGAVIRHFRIDEDEHPVEFSSLSDMAATLVAAFDENVFFLDPEGYLEMDDLRFASLAGQLNPTVAWWSED